MFNCIEGFIFYLSKYSLIASCIYDKVTLWIANMENFRHLWMYVKLEELELIRIIVLIYGYDEIRGKLWGLGISKIITALDENRI